MLNATTLKDDIITALELNPYFSDDLSTNAPAQVAYLSILTQKIVDHIVANLEIKNVTMTTGPSFLNSPITLIPVALDGGAAVSAQMVANTTAKTISQNNNGVGLVA